jgi:DNA-binding MarR family transcriptional regulator
MIPKTAKDPLMPVSASKRSAELDSKQGTEVLDSLIGYNLKRVYITMQADFRATLADEELSPRMFSVLSMTVETPGITQSEVARLLGIERSGLVAIVDALEQRGFVARASVKGDRRAQALVPKPKGQSFYRMALAVVRAHEEKLLSALSPEERAQLLDLLLRIRRAGGGEGNPTSPPRQ